MTLYGYARVSTADQDLSVQEAALRAAGPAGSTKYGYRINDNLEGDADAWFEKSTQHPGSWWPGWARWLGQYAGGDVDARVPGEGGSGVVEEDAPGGRARAEDRSDVAAASGTSPG